ncbi:HAMP domain-containing protein [Desulforhopalus vacuolatus]|uniref:ATP-binding protein n=1 Tax=Desulforhopalus vacuolatus TaxID=40414 RepID=UPI001965ED2C|nr:ATP-binding protein [Desulforhopalus vacuolatus]MBM9519182.1 HAMP domain-containing protein [Desulforhopalus vacuolatus]
MNLKIRHKIFFILLVGNAVLFIGFVFMLHWSFDRNFHKHIERLEGRQLSRLSQEISQLYEKQGNWNFIRNNLALWFSLNSYVTNSVFPFDRHDKEKFVMPDKKKLSDDFCIQSVPVFFEPRSVWPRVMLFDSNHKWLVGGAGPDVAKRLHLQVLRGEDEFPVPLPPDSAMGKGRKHLRPPPPPTKIWTKYSEMQPVLVDGKPVGYLAMLPIPQISLSRDIIFFQHQEIIFGVIALIGFVFAVLVALPLTGYIVRPIRELADATRCLMNGKFTTRISVKNCDELGQLSLDFNALAATLERNEEDRQQWVADISHELRTPLAVLCAEIESIQDGIHLCDARALDILHGEVMHIERLVRDLHEVSMSDLGAMTYRKAECDPFGILTEVVEGFIGRFESMGLTLELNLPKVNGKSPRMLADPGRLHQLFSNLLENSRRYTQSPGHLKISGYLEKELITILFQDSAPGVKDENLPRLFERLFREDASRTQKGMTFEGRHGSGLGLSICRNIVKAHEGVITAGHSPLGGLEMKIELPIN